MRETSRRPLGPFVVFMLLGMAILASASALEWDWSSLTDAASRERAFDRLFLFISSFGAPDLSTEFLGYGLKLTAQTLATALIGSVLGALLGWGLALGASRAVVLGREPRPRFDLEGQRGAAAKRLLKVGLLESCRVVLDVLRGVPDFAWALLILTGPGPGSVTGIVAIAISMAGILGKIYSELWDGVDPSRYEAMRVTGAGRLSTLFYGIQPLAARSMLSYTLMRTECAIRNASVIGAVGGGGLGRAMFDELNFGNYPGVVTLLFFTLLLTMSADFLSNVIRHHLRGRGTKEGAVGEAQPLERQGAAHPLRDVLRRRLGVTLGILGLLTTCAVFLGDAFRRAGEEMGRIEWSFITREFGRFLNPDVSGEAILDALQLCRVPLALGVIGTLSGVVFAMLLAYPASVAMQVDASRFTGERRSLLSRLMACVRVVTTRFVALLCRAIPEVAWVWIFAAFFTIGVVPGVFAMMLHTLGLLCRVYTESVDNLRYRHLEQGFLGSKFNTFVYSAVPRTWKHWKTYAIFQFESNVRAGVVFGIIGIGGLGDAFHTEFSMRWNLERAATYLVAMVLLTTVIDRISRRLNRG